MNDKKNDGGTLGCLFTIIFFGAIIYWAYSGLDSAGWISHTEETVITAQDNWLVGENKACVSIPLDSESARLTNKDFGYAFSKIECDDGPTHDMKVTFYGRENQPEYKGIMWRCTREEVSFSNENTFKCVQTGAW